MEKLKFCKLFLKDHFTLLTSQAKSIYVFIYFFVHIRPEVFLIECILYFFGSQISFEKDIIMILQKIYKKNLNFRYLQSILFCKKAPPTASICKSCYLDLNLTA